MDEPGAEYGLQRRNSSRSDTAQSTTRTIRRRKLRRTLALDLLIHLAAGAAAGVATAPEAARYALLHRDWHHLGTIPVLAILYFLAASFVDRVIVQAVVRTTIGKAAFGLVVLRPDTGGHPSFGRLLAIEDYFPTAVRWSDLRARKPARATASA
jgi:hypothetical protein